MAKLLLARALRDIPHLAVRGGDLVSGDEAQIKVLQADGSVDPHTDALAAARNAGAKTVKLPELPDPVQIEALQTAHARVHHLEGLLQASPEGERAALVPQLEAARAALAKLQA